MPPVSYNDVRFVLHILDFLKAPVDGPVPLMIDNEGMWFNVRNEGVSQLSLIHI